MRGAGEGVVGSVPLPAALPFAQPGGVCLSISLPPSCASASGCGSPHLPVAPCSSARAAARPPCLPSPSFLPLVAAGPETCLFRWLIVKGFDLQLTPGQDFLSTNPALFKHKNTLPSFLASVILIPPALTPRPASKSRLHRLRVGGGRPGLRLQDGVLGPRGPSRTEPMGTQPRKGGGRAAPWHLPTLTRDSEGAS